MHELPADGKYPVEAENADVQMEYSTSGQHRLVSKTDPEDRTEWAAYTGTTYLNGWVGATDYYTGKGSQILAPEEFVKITSVRKKTP